MKTKHIINIGKAQNMSQLDNCSVDLIVTSPPYPMIKMWDNIMSLQNPEIKVALQNGNGTLAFDLMHKELDKVWAECFRVLKEGGIACINIGDATRTIYGNFSLCSNHAKIINSCVNLGFSNISNIIWRKQTNAPNKFMGSGMLPAGAYVTLEHEWILIFRKGKKRIFKTEIVKAKRRNSSYFWEERNVWFSDVWDLKGVKQKLTSNSRERSAAFPLALPYRLINMYSVKDDIVLDPFLGTGTTTVAAILSQRNSIGYEIDETFSDVVKESILGFNIDNMNSFIKSRLDSHNEFIEQRKLDITKNAIKHFNEIIGVPVVTSQEKDIDFSYIDTITIENQLQYTVNYK